MATPTCPPFELPDDPSEPTMKGDTPRSEQHDLPEYLVVWRDEDEVLQSSVKTNADPKTLDNNDWVWLAAISEGYTHKDANVLVEKGYDLYLVCPFPSAFYDY